MSMAHLYDTDSCLRQMRGICQGIRKVTKRCMPVSCLFGIMGWLGRSHPPDLGEWQYTSLASPPVRLGFMAV